MRFVTFSFQSLQFLDRVDVAEYCHDPSFYDRSAQVSEQRRVRDSKGASISSRVTIKTPGEPAVDSFGDVHFRNAFTCL